MGRKKQKEPVEEVESEPEEEEDEDEEEEEMELLQVDVGDMIKVKQILDETVAATVLEQIDEDYQFDNFKLLLMTIACIFAVIAQFAPLPFPDSRIIIGLCCAAINLAMERRWEGLSLTWQQLREGVLMMVRRSLRVS